MKVEVEIDEWMDAHDVAEEVDAAARRVLDGMVRDKLMAETSRGKLDTAISNAGYSAVKDMLDEADPAWFDKLGEKVKAVVADLSSYTVFHDSTREDSVFGRRDVSYGAEALYRAIDAHAADIDARVEALVAQVGAEQVARAAGEALADRLAASYAKEKEEGSW